MIKRALALAILVPAAATAGPAGEEVISGEASFTRDGSLTLITTGTTRTIVNYTSFDIGRTEAVRIDQPSARSMILNNVLSTDPTKIDGMLTSNGQVFIANPVGVFFGDQAIVDVGRLVAAAGTVDAEQLLSGSERFSGLSGPVEVGAGAQIRAADSVLLVGAAVANYGNISATDGMVALVAGGEVKLARVDGRVIVTADRAIAPDPARWGVVQAGEIEAGRGVSLTAGDAYSLAINHEGITRAPEIAIAGGDGMVSVSGELDASDARSGATGGEIAVTGRHIALLDAQLDASGAAGGGRIRVGGDLQGQGTLPNAQRTYVDGDTALRADAIETGDGGQIIVWSDEATRFYGTLSARGGATSGDGGFAEISGASLVARGSVDLGASAGSTGTLLYDPKDIELHAGTADGSDDPDANDDQLDEGSLGEVFFNSPGVLNETFDVYESELEGTNANIELRATNAIASGDTFTVDLGDRSLEMETRNDDGDEVDGVFAPGIHLAGVSFETDGGEVELTTGNGSIEIGDLTTRGTNGEAGGDVTIRARGTGTLTVGAIDARGGDGETGGAGGDVTLEAHGRNTLTADSLTVASIDVSGGDSSAGRGGNGGTISLTADDEEATAVTDPAPRSIAVNGDLRATGGSGSAIEDEDQEQAEGGSGGQIALTAGIAADEDGTIEIAPGAVVDASGGDGTAGGGDASVTAITLAATGDIDVHGTLSAIGGDTTAGGFGGFGGQGGVVSIDSAEGSVTLHQTSAVVVDGGDGRTDGTIEIVNEVAQFRGQGGSAGRLDVSVDGTGQSIAALGTVQANGGDGLEMGAGGAGGAVTLTAADGAVTIADVELIGGSGSGQVDVEIEDAEGGIDVDTQVVKGGNGGSLTVSANLGTEDDAAGGNAFLAGTIVSLGGAGVADPDNDVADPRENHGIAGNVSITSALDITAAPGATAPRIQAGTIALSGRNVFAGSSAPLVLASSGDTGPESFVDTATVTAGNGDEDLASTGNVDVRLDDTLEVDRFEIAETDTRGHVFVRSADGSQLLAEGDGADGAGTVHTITSIDTVGRDTHFTYRLADGGGGPVDQVDVALLEVGGVTFGTKGGTIANARADTTAQGGERLLGRIEGAGAGPHIALNSDADGLGNVQLFATSIGVAGPVREALVVDGASGDSAVQMDVSGDVDLDTTGDVAIVDVTQRRASGDIHLDLASGAAGLEVEIDGSITDTGSSRVETTNVTRVDTTASQTAFFFSLADTSASSEVPNSGEPVLTIESGAVTLGAAAGFAGAGNVVLAAGAEPAIDANGNTVSVIADANGNSAGALIASGGVDVDDAGGLVVSGEGVGSETTPLRTRTAGVVVLAGSAGDGGDFYVTNEAGEVEIGTVVVDGVVDGELTSSSFSGITAVDGDVVIDNGTGDIVLGEIVQPEDDELVAHVTTGGSQVYTGTVKISNLTTYRTDPDDEDSTVTKNAALLVAGDDVRIDGNIDTHEDDIDVGRPGSFAVEAEGTVELTGDVGGLDDDGAATIDHLALSDTVFTAVPHDVTVASAEFDRIDGPGSLVLRGVADPSLVGDTSEIVFRDDVGSRSALALFDADATRLEFGTGDEVGQSADRIVAGEVRLNADGPTTTSPIATIVDTSRGLSIESAGDVTMGTGEKLTSTERLAIRARGTARLADLSAKQIDVNADQILIQTRDPGAVELRDGSEVMDFGVDWAANDITTNVAPQADGDGPAPTFVLGSGGIRTGGGQIPFDVIRLTADSDEIEGATFVGQGGTILDLVGQGPRVVADASDDIPHAAPPVLPGLAARPSDDLPSPPRVISSQEVMSALHCRTATGELCTPPGVGDDPLTTERAHEIVSRYRALIASDAGQQKLRSAFAPLATSSAPGAALARDPALGPARERIGELAVTLTQVELLGLEAEATQGVRRAIASDFAAATGVAGLDAEAVLSAVDASGVAALPR